MAPTRMLNDFLDRQSATGRRQIPAAAATTMTAAAAACATTAAKGYVQNAYASLVDTVTPWLGLLLRCCDAVCNNGSSMVVVVVGAKVTNWLHLCNNNNKRRARSSITQ